MRLDGKICCWCRTPLPPPYPGRERSCSRCGPPGTHRIYMYFFRRDGWHCQFLEPDLKTSLGRTLTFRDAPKIRAMHDRFAAEQSLEHRQALDYAIEIGRGGIWLNLTAEQYRKLLR
jgi:hypothetical protein